MIRTSEEQAFETGRSAMPRLIVRPGAKIDRLAKDDRLRHLRRSESGEGLGRLERRSRNRTRPAIVTDFRGAAFRRSQEGSASRVKARDRIDRIDYRA
ncbi:MAG TPA: hypothetical protein DCQ98_18210 [Planctomycetaceae bacterium]|nr:hypothetical protein [Planctomycetaceae bacterium]